MESLSLCVSIRKFRFCDFSAGGLFPFDKANYEPLKAGGSGYALTPWSITLSSYGAHTAVLEAPAFESDRERFFRILLHDDRNSFYVLSTDDGGTWTDIALKSDAIVHYPFNLVSDYYITHNGFTGKRRLSVRTRQLNALFFDLDCHDVPLSACERLIEEILSRLNHAVQTAALPKPTMIVNSGRGVHLYYILDRSIPYRFRNTGEVNEKGVSFFGHVQGQLADVLDEILDDVDGVSVDRSVFDHTRVSRIPNTYNTKAGRHARLVSAVEAYYSLSELSSYKPLVPVQVEPELPQKKQTRRTVIMKFDRLMMSRLNKVAELQAYRHYDCEGNRELMCFVYYNTAVQIYSKEDAWLRLQSFNARFNKPLSNSELLSIQRSVSNVLNVKGERGYYILSAKKVIESLAMTKEEMEDTHFFASKRVIDRLEAKRRTKEKRDARDERIVSLFKSGNMSKKEVAAEVGCSERTVHSVLKAAGLTKVYKTSEKKEAVASRTVVSSHIHRTGELVEALQQGHFSSPERESFIFSLATAKIWPTCLLSSVEGEGLGLRALGSFREFFFRSCDFRFFPDFWLSPTPFPSETLLSWPPPFPLRA
ncbi:MAG: hypothetical protein IKL97_07225 [Eggerthellaceae bacterium]|nr:hypothetical protein [Eggerthellaceae bacterium]